MIEKPGWLLPSKSFVPNNLNSRLEQNGQNNPKKQTWWPIWYTLAEVEAILKKQRLKKK